MESETDARLAEARATLDAIALDREALAVRTRSPRWYYPLLAVCTAAIVASPAMPGMVGMFATIALAAAGIVLIEWAWIRTTGVSTNRVPGPRSVLVLVAMGVIVLAMLGVSVVLVALGLPLGVVATAAVAAAAMYPGGLVYDRVYSSELRRGR